VLDSVASFTNKNLPTLDTVSYTPRVLHQIPVVIIGAGLAGLTVSHHLRRAGFQPQIMESNNESGGRVKTRSVAANGKEVLIEDGAEHLSNHDESILQLSRELGCDEKKFYDRRFLQPAEGFSEDGNHFTEKQLLECCRDFLLWINDKSVMLYGQNLEAVLDLANIPGFAKRWLSSYFECEYGRLARDLPASLLEDLDLLESGFLHPIGHESSTLAGGMGQLPKKLSATAKINFGVKALSVARSQSRSGFIINLSDGESVYAEAVVVTGPYQEIKNIDLSQIQLPNPTRKLFDVLPSGEHYSVNFVFEKPFYCPLFGSGQNRQSNSDNFKRVVVLNSKYGSFWSHNHGKNRPTQVIRGLGGSKLRDFAVDLKNQEPEAWLRFNTLLRLPDNILRPKIYDFDWAKNGGSYPSLPSSDLGGKHIALGTRPAKGQKFYFAGSGFRVADHATDFKNRLGFMNNAVLTATKAARQLIEDFSF